MVLSELKEKIYIYRYENDVLKSYYVMKLGISPTKFGYLDGSNVVPILEKDLANFFKSEDDAEQGTLFGNYS